MKGLDESRIDDFVLQDEIDFVDPPYVKVYQVMVFLKGREQTLHGSVQCVFEGSPDWSPIWDTFEED